MRLVGVPSPGDHRIDHKGTVLASCYKYLIANSMAILKGLQFGKACCRESPVCVESDDTAIMKLINDTSHLNSDCGVILSDIASISNHLSISSVLPFP
ncbi:hypothetical protein Dsin_020163 [Dipteronia sinensis]|uniref:RNase H type-1 domain-containing protein n=1 Tax=Dipteronia sinensis TaxID=43782 RepID=A0AAE0A8P5_9ROSI|nr:hypothetical protein Dsin_020163 [Dipteronia sinensis]